MDNENENLWNMEDAIVDPEPMTDVGELQESLLNIRILQKVAHQFNNNLKNQDQGVHIGWSCSASRDCAHEMAQPIIDFTPNEPIL